MRRTRSSWELLSVTGLGGQMTRQVLQRGQRIPAGFVDFSHVLAPRIVGAHLRQQQVAEADDDGEVILERVDDVVLFVRVIKHSPYPSLLRSIRRASAAPVAHPAASSGRRARRPTSIAAAGLVSRLQ